MLSSCMQHIDIGQFMDNTITETKTTKVKDESWFILVSPSDRIFKSDISFFRTIRNGHGNSISPENNLSSHIDAASVYGVTEKEAKHLREHRGGRLKLPGNFSRRTTQENSQQVTNAPMKTPSSSSCICCGLENTTESPQKFPEHIITTMMNRFTS